MRLFKASVFPEPPSPTWPGILGIQIGRLTADFIEGNARGIQQSRVALFITLAMILLHILLMKRWKRDRIFFVTSEDLDGTTHTGIAKEDPEQDGGVEPP